MKSTFIPIYGVPTSAGGAFTSSGGFTTLRTASDLVGIGTSTPGEKLSINGGAFFDSDIIRYGSSSQPTLLFKYAASSTSTIPNLIKNVFSFATSSTASPGFLSLDTLNYRIGIGTTSPITTFSLKGSQYLTGGLGIGNATTTSGILETSGIGYIGGVLKGASTFTFAGAGSSFLQGALGIATTTPAERFSINGGAFFDSDIIRYGSSSAPTLNFRYFASSTSTIPNLTSAFTFATSTTNTPLLTLSTKSSRYGRVGIGTSSPSALFAINALNSSNQAENLFYVGSSTANNFVVDNHGNVGIGDASPVALFTVGSGDLFQVISTGEARGIAGAVGAPSFSFTGDTNTGMYSGGVDILRLATAGADRVSVDASGNVGIGTTSPVELFSVGGDAYVDKLGIGGKATSFPLEISTLVNNRVIQIQNSASGAGQNTFFRFQVDVSTAANNIGYADGSWSGGGADVAEWFPTNDRTNLEFGDLVSIDRVQLNIATTSIKSLVKKTTDDAEDRKNVIGIVSTAPGLVSGFGEGFGEFQDDDEFRNANAVQVALAGRVPVKVTTENGPIAIGDRITSSSLPGVGMKATKDGMTVGIALEPFGCATSDESHNCATSDKSQIGKILVFVNLGYSKLDVNQESGIMNQGSTGWSIDPATGQISSNGFGLDMAGADIMNVKAIMSASGNWRIGEDGELVVQGLEVKGKGITLFASDGNPYCARVEIGGAIISTPGKCNE